MARKPKHKAGHNSGPTGELRQYIDRMINLIEQKKAIAGDIKDLKAEAKNRGFDVAAIDNIVKEINASEASNARRREIEMYTDIYRASLGMLNGTPLGEAARKRMANEQPDETEGGDQSSEDTAAAAREALTEEDIAAAREAGRQAHRDRKRVIDNPFVAGDPRRAAWDEGWCAESGSDGMDIPKAWRRSEKPKQTDASE